MQLLLNRFFSRDLGWRIGGIVFFVIFYVYLWMGVKPQLIYHGGGELTNFPVFYKGWAFAEEIILHPGGPVEYLSAFLSQLLYLSWAGALVLTVHALLVSLFTGYFLKKTGITRFHILSFIPAILLLITYNGYTCHFTTTLAFLAALIFSCLYVKAVSKDRVLSPILFLLLSVVLYLIGAGAYLFFALMCGIYEIFFRRRLLIGLLYGVLAVSIGYIVGVLVFNISLLDVYSKLLPFSWRIIEYPERRIMIQAVYVLYLFLPSTVIVFGLYKLFTQSRFYLLHIKNTGRSKSLKAKEKKKALKSEKSTQAERTAASNFLKTALSFGFIFIIAGGAVLYFSDFERKAVFEVDYCLNNRDWKKVLETGRHYQNNDHIMHALNRALYHLGILASDMFCYQQRPRCLLLSAPQEMASPWQKVDTYYDLGTLNHCESALAESLAIYGEHPEILKRLAIVRIAKNDIDTARVYLEALNRTLFYCDWAKVYLQRLETDPNMSTDKEIQRLRSLMPEKDKGSVSFSMEEQLIALLERNPKNRMAFEYLMAFYMFRLDLDKFVQNIGRLDDFDYPQIPRHYEEAILTYIYLTKKTPDLKGRRISEKSQQRFSSYLQLATRYGGNQQAAFSPLAKNYSDTYYFYYVYSVSGLQNE